MYHQLLQIIRNFLGTPFQGFHRSSSKINIHKFLVPKGSKVASSSVKIYLMKLEYATVANQ